MTSFVSSVTVLSVSLISVALLKLIAPCGNTEKILKRVISVFVIICLVMCIRSVVSLVNTEIISDVADENSDNVTASISESVLTSTADYLADYIRNLLIQEGVAVSSTEVTLNVDSENVINISNICIYIDKSTDTDINQIEEIIFNNLGTSPQISVKEEE